MSGRVVSQSTYFVVFGTLIALTGIAWMRQYLGEDVEAPIHHPDFSSAFDLRVLGVKIPAAADTTSATIISSVGCPMGCNFCTTSAFFGGKGKILNFYETGEQLF